MIITSNYCYTIVMKAETNERDTMYHTGHSVWPDLLLKVAGLISALQNQKKTIKRPLLILTG